MSITLPEKKILSVSVAAYNSEATLRKTISSFVSDPELLEQIEIIIVNDGSSDNTSIIAHEFKTAYPNTVIVIDKQNGGYGSTINSSLKIAKGKYYRLVDGDDWIDSSNLKEFINFLSQTDADMVISPYYEVRESTQLINNHPEIPLKMIEINNLELNSLFFVMHEITIRTDKLRNHKVKISENCFYTDTEYNVIAFLCTKTIACFDQPVYCYRMGVNGQSMSMEGIRKHYKDMISVSISIIQMIQESDFISESTRNKILRNYVKHVVLYATYAILTIQDRKQSQKELLRYEQTLKVHFPEAYQLSNKRKFLRIARCLHYNPFSLVRRYAATKYV